MSVLHSNDIYRTLGAAVERRPFDPHGVFAFVVQRLDAGMALGPLDETPILLCRAGASRGSLVPI